jgi:hypothetical protein
MTSEVTIPGGGLHQRQRYWRALAAMLAAYSGLTTVWIATGMLTGGDSFAIGSPLAFVVPGAAALLAGVAGWRIRSRRFRFAMLLAALGATLFWTVVPDGWWAAPPPPSSRTAPG